MADFPDGLTTWTDVVNGVNYPQASHVNDAWAEIIAIETELGYPTAPDVDTIRGSMASLRERLNVSLAQDGTLNAITADLTLTQNLSIGKSLTITQNLTVDTNTLIVNSTTNMVGILNASPSYALDVTGTIRATASLLTDTGLYVNETGTGNRYASMNLVGDDTYDYGFRALRYNTGVNASSYLGHRGTGGFYIVAEEAATMYLCTTSTARLTITSGGLVGIGTVNPGTNIEVQNAGTSVSMALTGPDSGSEYAILYLVDYSNYIKKTYGGGLDIVATNGISLYSSSVSVHSSLILYTPGTYYNNIAIKLDTSDDSDTGCLQLCGGGGNETNRGGSIYLYGNEHTTLPGKIILQPGSSGRINLYNLPTSDSGLVAGDLWRDADTVKIKY